MVLCEAGLLKQTLQVFVGQLRRVLDKGYNVGDAFVPFLQGLLDDPTLACGHALHMATALLSMHLPGIEVWPWPFLFLCPHQDIRAIAACHGHGGIQEAGRLSSERRFSPLISKAMAAGQQACSWCAVTRHGT